jgi:tetratricopeptide (TPR) repeat protein
VPADRPRPPAHLENRPDVAEIRQRHADYYLALTEEADIRLRGIGHNEWLERLQTAAGNLAAAVRWYVANDISPLPHLFRVLWSFWFLREHMGEAREWVNQTIPAVDSLDATARAELLWTAQVAALEVGDDAAALAAGERLGPLLPGIQDPFLRAAARLARAWTLPIVGGIEEALLEASASLDQFHAQDEPFWTTLALGSLGTVESNAGRNDDAVGHLSEARNLADRFDHPWLAAWSRTLLDSMAVAAGRLDEARALLDDALGLSLAARSTNGVTLCLIAYARLALADRDPERAAQLAGAAEGLRGRAGLRVWPTLRPGEAELVAQLHEVLAHRFDKEYATGTQLNQQQAIATIRDEPGRANRPPTMHSS